MTKSTQTSGDTTSHSEITHGIVSSLLQDVSQTTNIRNSNFIGANDATNYCAESVDLQYIAQSDSNKKYADIVAQELMDHGISVGPKKITKKQPHSTIGRFASSLFGQPKQRVVENVINYCPQDDINTLIVGDLGKNNFTANNSIIHVAPHWLGDMLLINAQQDLSNGTSVLDKVENEEGGSLSKITEDKTKCAMRYVLSNRSGVTTKIDSSASLNSEAVDNMFDVSKNICSVPVVTAARVGTGINHFSVRDGGVALANTPLYQANNADTQVVLCVQGMDFNSEIAKDFILDSLDERSDNIKRDVLIEQTAKDSFTSCLVAAAELGTQIVISPPIGAGEALQGLTKYQQGYGYDNLYCHYTRGIAQALKDYSSSSKYSDKPMHLVMSSKDLPLFHDGAKIQLENLSKDWNWNLNIKLGGLHGKGSIVLTHPEKNVSLTIVDESLLLLQSVYKHKYGKQYGDVGLVVGGTKDNFIGKSFLCSGQGWGAKSSDAHIISNIDDGPVNRMSNDVMSVVPSAAVALDAIANGSAGEQYMHIYDLDGGRKEGFSSSESIPKIYTKTLKRLNTLVRKEGDSDLLDQAKLEKRKDILSSADVANIPDAAILMLRLVTHPMKKGGSAYAGVSVGMQKLSEEVFSLEQQAKIMKGAQTHIVITDVDASNRATIKITPVYALMFSKDRSKVQASQEQSHLLEFYTNLFAIMHYVNKDITFPNFLKCINNRGDVVFHESLLGEKGMHGFSEALDQMMSSSLLDKVSSNANDSKLSDVDCNAPIVNLLQNDFVQSLLPRMMGVIIRSTEESERGTPEDKKVFEKFSRFVDDFQQEVTGVVNGEKLQRNSINASKAMKLLEVDVFVKRSRKISSNKKDDLHTVSTNKTVDVEPPKPTQEDLQPTADNPPSVQESPPVQELPPKQEVEQSNNGMNHDNKLVADEKIGTSIELDNKTVDVEPPKPVQEDLQPTADNPPSIKESPPAQELLPKQDEGLLNQKDESEPNPTNKTQDNLTKDDGQEKHSSFVLWGLLSPKSDRPTVYNVALVVVWVLLVPVDVIVSAVASVMSIVSTRPQKSTQQTTDKSQENEIAENSVLNVFPGVVLSESPEESAGTSHNTEETRDSDPHPEKYVHTTNMITDEKSELNVDTTVENPLIEKLENKQNRRD